MEWRGDVVVTGIVDAAFDEVERAALELPERVLAELDEVGAAGDAALRVLADGTVRYRGPIEPIRAWRDACLTAAWHLDPFARWTTQRSLAQYRGLIDTTAATAPADPVGGLPAVERRAVRRARLVDERATLLTAIERDELDAWLLQPVGRLGRVSRYLHELWLGRADLHGLFPRVGNRDDSTTRFLAWVVETGASEHAVPARFLPTPEQHRPRVSATTSTRRGVRLVGHLDATLGIGESARRMRVALEHAGIEVLDWHDPASAELDVNLVCLNADELGQFADDIGDAFFADRHTIGMWYWEVDGAPTGIENARKLVDEIWVASEFVAAAVRPHVDVPVHVVPLPVRIPEPSERTRESLGMPAGFLFGYVFDFNSTIERKQPLALIEAYRTAFPSDDGATGLIVKTINSAVHPDASDRVADAAGGREDIVIVDGLLPLADRDALMAHLDCYVSLHRSEGFGLTIAEALLAGVPVIATGYGANVEFAGADSCDLVDFTIVDVDIDVGPYAVTGRWADPDVGHAAELMRAAVERPAELARRTNVGRTTILERYSLDAAAARVAQLVEDGWQMRPVPEPAPVHPDHVALVEQYVADGPAMRWEDGPRGLRGWIRGLTRRALRPYTERHVEFERSVAASLRSLRSDVDELQNRRP